MKKRFGILIFILALLLVGCSSEKSDLKKYDEEEMLKMSKEIIDTFNDKEFETFVEKYPMDDLEEEVTVEDLEDAYYLLDENYGKFEKTGKYLALEEEDEGYLYGVIEQEMIYEDGKAIFSLSFDENYKLAGFYIK